MGEVTQTGRRRGCGANLSQRVPECFMRQEVGSPADSVLCVGETNGAGAENRAVALAGAVELPEPLGFAPFHATRFKRKGSQSVKENPHESRVCNLTSRLLFWDLVQSSFSRCLRSVDGVRGRADGAPAATFPVQL